MFHFICIHSASSGTLTDENVPLHGSPGNERPEGSIANHYSNDPFHKNWRDSMDKKTKKEIMADFGKRRASQHSVDSLEEKKRSVVFLFFFLTSLALF